MPCSGFPTQTNTAWNRAVNAVKMTLLKINKKSTVSKDEAMSNQLG